jgi:hypothetical protein
MKILPIFFGTLTKIIFKDVANQMPMDGGNNENEINEPIADFDSIFAIQFTTVRKRTEPKSCL